MITDDELVEVMDAAFEIDISVTKLIYNSDLINFISLKDDPIFGIYNEYFRKNQFLKSKFHNESDWISHVKDRSSKINAEYSKIYHSDPMDRFNYYFSRAPKKKFLDNLKNLTNSFFGESKPTPITYLEKYNVSQNIVYFDKYLKNRIIRACSRENSAIFEKLPNLMLLKEKNFISFYQYSQGKIMGMVDQPSPTWGGERYDSQIASFVSKFLIGNINEGKKGYIYGGYTPENGRWYVGQTINFPEKRFLEHKINKTGPYRIGNEQVTWEVLEFGVEWEALDEREKHWIKEKSAYDKGYNRTSGNS